MAAIEERSGRFRIHFRWHGKQEKLALGKVSAEEAASKAAQVDYLLMRLKQRLIELPPDVDIIEVQVEQIDRMLVTNVDFEGGSVTRREKKRVKGKLSTRRLGFAAPIWMTFNQANELKSNVRKGSKGSLVVYADRITKTEIAEHGEETERDIYFMNVSGRSKPASDGHMKTSHFEDYFSADRLKGNSPFLGALRCRI